LLAQEECPDLQVCWDYAIWATISLYKVIAAEELLS